MFDVRFLRFHRGGRRGHRGNDVSPIFAFSLRSLLATPVLQRSRVVKDVYAGTSRTLPSFQTIIGKPRRRSSARFFRVARLCACDAMRASRDILLSGIGFSPLYRFFFMEGKEPSQLNNTVRSGFKFVSARCRNQHAGSMRSP